MNRDDLKDGMLVQDATGVQFRVTQAHVPDTPNVFPADCFELVRVTPPAPFVQAPSLAVKYEATHAG